MWWHTQFQSSRSRPTARWARRASAARLLIEPLEDRSLPSFLGPVSYPVGTPDEHSAADFDNDGILDLIVKNGHMVGMLRGNGDGTFQPAVNFNAGTTPYEGGGTYSLAVGDFNTDGELDVVTATEYRLSLLLGDGHGSLGIPTTVDGLGNGGSVAVGDFNADGKLDLGVAMINVYQGGYGNYYIPFAKVLLGDGHGGFSPPTTIQVGELGYSPTATVATADLNGDGMQDLLVDVPDYGTVSVMLNDGLGNLQAPTAFPAGAGGFPYRMATGDVDGDGDIDLVTVGYSVSVMINDGLGAFGSPQDYFVGVHEGSVLLRDFNNDGKLDIAMTEGWERNLTVVLGKGDGTFSAPLMFDGPGGWFGSTAGDFNGDGWLDLATSNTNTPGFSVWINDHAWSGVGMPSLAIGDATVTEGNTGTRSASFTVTLSVASSQPVTVAYATANSTATAGNDYRSALGTLTFAPGETSKTITILANGDRLPEPNESFFVNLSNPTNATLADGQGIGTIVDDEPRISISEMTKAEGQKGKTTLFTFEVTLSVAYDQLVTMSYHTANGTAKTSNGDYVPKTGTLTFAPGETTKTITIEVKGDSKRESNEYFYLDLFDNSSNSLFTKNRGTGTILNDD
jgi:hypothetical protein